MELEQALENIIRLLSDITFVPFAVGLVVVITQFLKALVPGLKERGAIVALVVQVIVWVAYSILKSKGLEVQFETWVEAATTILGTLLAVLFPAVLSAGATKNIYDRMHNREVPGFQMTSRKAYKA